MRFKGREKKLGQKSCDEICVFGKTDERQMRGNKKKKKKHLERCDSVTAPYRRLSQAVGAFFPKKMLQFLCLMVEESCFTCHSKMSALFSPFIHSLP